MDQITAPAWEAAPSEYDNRREFVQSITDGEHAGTPYMKASLKNDGCVDFRRVYNIGSATEDADYLHICDLDQLIADLIALRMIQQDLEAEGFIY